MNKILRYASVVALALVSSLAFAQTTVTFTAGETVGNNESASGADQMSKDGITITTTAGGFNCTYKGSGQYRFAKGSTNTITSTIGNITKIEFTCTANGDAKYGPGNFVATNGSYSYEGTIGTWTGDDATATLTAEAAQVRATQIVVTVGGSGDDPTPTPDPQPGVTFTNGTIASLNGLAEDVSNVNLTLSNAKVVYVNGGAVSVREGDKAILFYHTGLDLKTNATLNGNVKVDFDNYYGMPEVKKNDYTNADSLSISVPEDTTTLDAVIVTLDEILALSHVADLVKVENVTITKDGNNHYAVSGENRVQLYRNIANVAAYEGQTVTIYAVFNNIYKGSPEMSVVAIEGGQVQVETAANIAEFKQKAATAVLTLANAQVLYAGQNDIFVRDATGAIDFYMSGLDWKQNQTLNGTITGTYASYNNLPELTSPTDNNVAATDGEAAVAHEVGLDEISAEGYACDLIQVSDLTLKSIKSGEYTNVYAYSEDGDSIQVYDKFQVVKGEFAEGKTYTIKGILVPYQDRLEIYPIEDYTNGETPEPQVETAANIAEFKQKATTAVLTLTNAQVLYAGQNDIFVRDASGAIDFYKSNLDWKQNQVLNGTITGTYATFNNLPELTSPTDVNVTAVDGEAAEVHEVAISDLTAEAYGCDLVQVSGVTLKSFTSGEYTNIYAYNEAGDSIQVYDKFRLVSGEIVEGQAYTIKGILVPYRQTVELCPIEDYTSGVTPEPTVITAENIAAFKALENGTTATLTLTDAQVLYTWTSNNGNTQTYVRDASGAIMLYNTGLELAQSQMVNGTVSLKLSIYNNLPEAVKADDTNADNLTITEGATAEPKAIAVADAANYVSDLVVLEGVSVIASEDGSRFYATSGDDNLQIYNGFHLDDYTIGTTADGETTTVKGIIAQYRSTYEIYPIEQVVTGIEALKADSAASAPAYNLAGQQVNASYKGVVVKAGKKYLQK